MNLMNRFATRLLPGLFSLLLLGTVGAWGQASPAAGGAEKQEVMAKLEKMSTELQLTPDQKKQIMPILMQEAPKLKAVKANASLGPLQKAMQMKEIGNETDTRLKPILTPQQYDKFQQMRAEEREQMMQQMRGPQ